MNTPGNLDPASLEADDLLPEYQFDYRNARKNRFAGAQEPGSRTVVLEPDVAAVFTTPEAVNAVLRALITTMPDLDRARQVA